MVDTTPAPWGAGDGTRAGARLIVLIGVAGSGKSTLAAELWGADCVLSLDALRGVVSGSSCDQSATADAVTLLHLALRARLRRQLTSVVDATNVQATARRPLLDLAAEAGVPAVAVIVATSLRECLARNATRPGPLPAAQWGRRVPDAVVRAQHEQLLTSLPVLHGEGFASVVTYTRPETATGPVGSRAAARAGRPGPLRRFLTRRRATRPAAARAASPAAR